MKLSIVLPIYSVEGYIARCIESCCEQVEINFSDYELILVDDSSPDKSIKIAEAVLQKHPEVNYTILKRPNGGLSAARNTGFDASSAQYVWFVDSDDYIAKNAVRHIIDAIEEYNNPEIISFTYTTVYPCSEKHCKFPDEFFEGEINGIEYLKRCEFLSAWSRVYSSEFIRVSGIRFTEGIIWEDGEFNFKLFSINKRHVCIPENLYYYIRRPGSISTTGFVEKTLSSNIKIFDNHVEWIRQHNFEKSEKSTLYRLVGKKFVFTLAGIPSLNDSKKRQLIYQKLEERKKIFKHICRCSSDWQLKILGIMYSIVPKYTAFVCFIKMQNILKKDYDHIMDK